MEVTTALLRIAARIAGASVVLVARPGSDVPVAAWGCDPGPAEALLRVLRANEHEGVPSFATLPFAFEDGGAAELIFVAGVGALDVRALTPLAAEIGKTCDPEGRAQGPSALERLCESIELLAEPIAVLSVPRLADPLITALHVNSAFTQLFGFVATEIVGRTIGERLWGPLTDVDRVNWIRARVAIGEQARAVIVLYGKDGAPRWTEVAATPVRAGEELVDFVVSFRDVTSRKQFEDALAAEKSKLQTTLAAIADAVVCVLPDGRVEFVNAAAQRLLGIALTQAYGAPVGEVLPLVDDDGRSIDLAGRSRGGDDVWRGEGHLRAPSGAIDVAFVASRIGAGEHGTVVVLRDVTLEHRLALRLSFEASHDALTGLPNRRAFLDRLESAVRSAWEHGEHHVVGFLDLDRFKIVNDRFGHPVGDRVLRDVARVMGALVRSGDVLSRFGGDEFALLLMNCRMGDARRIAEKIRCAVESSVVEHGGELLGVGVSIGLAKIDATTLSASEALSAADAACYAAKNAGRNAVAG
ncbi:MAG TPA: diguanylate cyclase [Candidatus Baltobacteraceae bacterium]|nr:diguanylate cyclase [Candidatus Baltobacteraceae bacterium]